MLELKRATKQTVLLVLLGAGLFGLPLFLLGFLGGLPASAVGYAIDPSPSSQLLSGALLAGALLSAGLFVACAFVVHFSFGRITYATWLSFTGIVFTALVLLGGYGAVQGWFSGLLTGEQVLTGIGVLGALCIKAVGPQKPLTTWMTADRMLNQWVQDLDTRIDVAGRAFLARHLERIEQGWDKAKEVVRAVKGIYKPIEPTPDSTNVTVLANVRAKRAA